MDIPGVLNDKEIKAREKVEWLAGGLISRKIAVDDLLDVAGKLKDGDKANCVEALEFATRQEPGLGSVAMMEFMITQLDASAPRLKWESAKVIGNIAGKHHGLLEKSLPTLLTNTEHEGTVVRWSAAYALGEILKQGTNLNAGLLPLVEAIIAREEKNSIRKIYQDAMKKVLK